MALIGSIENQGTLQGQINDANGYLTGVISNAGLLGGQVVAERGLKGDKGDKGDTGATGSAATVSVGSTTTGAAGTSASVSNSGTSSAAIFDFIIPKGDKGDTGATGEAATIAIGSTSTGAAGTSASVVNSGTSTSAIFDFTIPKGDKGDTGNTGSAATIAIGSVSTGGAGTSASVVNSGTSTSAIFDFTIPKGDKGDTGASGSAATIAVGSVSTGAAGTSVSITNSGTSTSAIFDFIIPKGDKGDTGQTGSGATISIGSVTTGAAGTSASVVNSGTSTSAVLDFTIPKGDTGATGGVNDVEVNGTSVVNAGVAEVTVPTKTSDLLNDSLFARGHIGAFHGTCSTAAGTVEKAVTCADFTSADLVAGAMILVTFSSTNSGAVADLKLNVNSTGAYPIKQNNSGTLSNLDSAGYLKTGTTYPFIFNGSYWVTWYNVNTNTIGYTIRTNGMTLPVKTACYRYRICFTSADGTHYVPANASTSTSATASKTVTTEKIDPFGRIIYYSYTTGLSAGSNIGASYQMEQYNGVTLGYSFNRTGVALTMTANKPVYVKCTPQTDGSAIIDGTTPFVQDLPTTEDGKIYIFIGVATSATAIEFTLQHPVYCYKNGCVRQWTNADIPTIPVTDVTQNGISVLNGTTAEVTVPTDLGDLTNTAGYIKGMTILSYGSSTYNDALAAFQAKKIVYCKASSNADPSIGNQLRMAFLAYVNDSTTPTEFEFQYYRSVATHSDSQQGDQVFVYKLNSSGTWSVTTREAYSKVVAGTNMSSSYSSGKITLSATDTTYSDFTGTDGNSDGTHGLVPAPQTTDANKYLKADGTWATVSGGGSVTDVKQNGTSVLDGTVAKVITHDVPSGGLRGQFLTKDSVTDYDVTWTTPTLFGSTATKTPTEVKTALDNGYTVNINHVDNTYGLITANNFNDSFAAGVIVANVVFYYTGVGLLCFELIGNLNTDVWANNIYTLAQSSDIPTNISAFTNDSGYITTDINVTQTNATPSSYTYWRPLVVGTSSNSTEGFTPSTSTGTTYTFNTLEVQPSSGTIRMGCASMYQGSYTTKISPTTLTANRTVTIPNASGTMALTSDIHNVPSGGTTGQVLMKNSNTNYDCSWANLPIYNGGVS